MAQENATPAAPAPAAPQTGSQRAQAAGEDDKPVLPQDGKPAPAGQAASVKAKSAKDRLLEQVDEDGNVQLKIDGKLQKVSFDRALAELEMGFAGKKRFTEFDRERKAFEESKKRAKGNPEARIALLKEIDPDFDPDAWAEERILARIEAEKAKAANPLHSEQQKLAADRAKLEADRKDLEEKSNRSQLEFHQVQVDKMLTEHVPAALKAVELPHDDPDVLRDFKGYLGEAIAAGVELSPELVHHAASVAREADDARVSRTVLALDVPTMLKRFPEAGKVWIERLRRYDMEEYEKRRNGGQIPPPKVNGEAAPKRPASNYVSEAELRANYRKAGLL